MLYLLVNLLIYTEYISLLPLYIIYIIYLSLFTSLYYIPWLILLISKSISLLYLMTLDILSGFIYIYYIST